MHETRTVGGVKLPHEEQRDEELRCDGCGQAVESLNRCVWGESLLVGACCDTYTDHRFPAWGSDNLVFADGDVRCSECSCVTTQAACEITTGPSN